MSKKENFVEFNGYTMFFLIVLTKKRGSKLFLTL
jgi:hypothetical protein